MNNIIFVTTKCVTRPFRCIYVNWFIRLRFLPQVSTKLQKLHFLDNLRTTTQERNMETRQMSTFFYLLFPLYLFVTFISEFENTQNSGSCGPPLGPFWSVKYLNFYPKATNLDTSSCIC